MQQIFAKIVPPVAVPAHLNKCAHPVLMDVIYQITNVL